MKTLVHSNSARASERAMTLVELMVAMAIAGMVGSAILLTHLMGTKWYEMTAAKLSATSGARKTLSRLVTEIQEAKTVEIGQGNDLGFVQIPNDQSQVGNAIQIYPFANSTNFVRYYIDTDSQTIQRLESSNLLNPEVIVNYITNTFAFTSEDWDGTIKKKSENNRVIGLDLSFYRMSYPVVNFGPGANFEYFTVRTRVTRRALE